MNNAPDKKQLYNKVVYVYFCFFSMFIAERFSMNLTYGAALFFSLSALFRMIRFSARTPLDPAWLKAVKTVAAVFFILATAYIIALYPFLFEHRHTVYAMSIIALPFIDVEIENLLLRRRAKAGALNRKDIARAVIPVETGFSAAISLISLSAGLGVFSVVTAAVLLGMALNFFRQLIFRDFEEYPRRGAVPGNISVRSARLYDGMSITSAAALNIFAFTYVLFIMLSGKYDFFMDFLVVFGGLSMVFAVIYIATYRIVNAPLIQRIGKNAAYFLGTAVSIFAIYVFRNSWFAGTVAISMQTLLLLTGIILQMTGALGLKEDVLLVLKLYDPNIDEEAVEERKEKQEMWAAVISEAIFLIVLLFIISNPLFNMMNVREYIEYAPYIGSSVAAIPTFFLIISLVYSIKQPLTKKFGRRLEVLEDIKSSGGRNPDMEKRLKNVLIRKYKKRIGVYIIRAFLKGIMYHSVTGKENVSALPGVFVFNHGEVYGPIAAVVFLPYDIRPWILNKMIDKNEITEHMYEGTFGRIKWLPVFLRKFIVNALSPVVVWALRSFDPIPVYRGAGRELIKTFTLSIECLNSGDSILLFPENPEEQYGGKVSEFYSGFAGLGRMYHRKTGKDLTFYPVYASRRGRELRIGEGVKYDPKGSSEKTRIVETLKKSMAELQSINERQ